MTRGERVRRYGRALILWLLALVVAFVIVLGVSRVLGRAFGTDQAAVDAGVIATFAAVVGGVPVGLLAGYLAGSAARTQAAQERSERRTRLLRTIQGDLAENLAQLNGRDRTTAEMPFLRVDVWQMLAASGQLDLVDDPALLNILARAYHRIGTTAYLERQVWEAFHDPDQWGYQTSAGGGVATGLDVLLAEVRDQDPHTRAAIDVALEHLAQEVGAGAPPKNQAQTEP